MAAEKPTPPPIPRTRRQTLELKSDELEEVNLIEEARGLIKKLIETPLIGIFGKKIPHDPELLTFRALIKVGQLRKELGLPQMNYDQTEEVLEAIREEIINAEIAE